MKLFIIVYIGKQLKILINNNKKLVKNVNNNK